MKKNIMGKNLRKSIVRSLGRYIAILAIIALGASLFVGLLSTKSDMVATGISYMDAQNMFDLRLLSTYGWTQADVDAISAMDGVAFAQGSVIFDVVGRLGSGEEGVFQIYSMPDKINKVALLGGRMPTAPNECVADSRYGGEALLGTQFVISQENDPDTLDALNETRYTVVGYGSSPLFMDLSRGNTTLGNGSISAFVYLPNGAFDVDYYTQIDLTITGDYEPYTQEYDDAMDAMADKLMPALETLAQNRYAQIRSEAQEAYDEGAAEYAEGLAEFTEGENDARHELESGYQELLSAQVEIQRNESTLRQGLEELEEGQNTLQESKDLLAQSKAEAYAQLAEANAALAENYKLAADNLNTANSGYAQLTEGLAQLESGITQLESGITQLDITLAMVDSMLEVTETSIKTAQSALDMAQSGQLFGQDVAELQASLDKLKAARDSYVQKRDELERQKTELEAQLESLKAQQEELLVKKTEAEEAIRLLEDALVEINKGFMDLQTAQLELEEQFAAAQAEIDSGELALSAAAQELADGQKALEEGKAELEKGWQTYYAGVLEASGSLSDGRKTLSDAANTLADAKAEIDSLEAAKVYVLDRNTNASYLAVESNSDIVAGVSRVFPVFFLLVAALVCITTMTRMVEEERTQIGTLKALGYGNFAIISKYLIYAGSAAILGCSLGVIVGSVLFPKILWSAYSIILTLKPTIEIHFQVPLCLSVVLIYTLVMLLVTYYCCHRALKEVPAELIRPKAPTSGKKILLEHLPFWHKLSFLNKVMIRNIFRYRQRLFMMLIGIGGCTALLLTGFGIGDSIQNVASYQFGEITCYDIQVQFSEGQSQQQQYDFLDAVSDTTGQVRFIHQSSVDLLTEDASKSVYMIAPNGSLDTYLDLHDGDTKLSEPGIGEAVISVGAAEAMHIKTGDRITVRDTDMRTLELTVSGIFDNHVYSYVVVSPETVRAQWQEEPAYQMAYINVPDGADPHVLGARIADMSGVMSLMVCQDLEEQVSSMLEAMDMIVLTVVICAELLAIIVLYNLTNINITERMREIATIKVLGFTHIESALYVFKENLVLSVVGALLGLVGGRFLLTFVMSQIKIDMVWLSARIEPLSLILSVVITILMALIVDLILYFRLEKINMAEALKSVE